MTETLDPTPQRSRSDRYAIAGVLALLTVIAAAVLYPLLSTALEPSPARKAEINECVQHNIDLMVQSSTTRRCV